MKINSIRIKKVIAKNGLVAFCSFVIDDWLYLSNIAIFTRLSDDKTIRLVFPEKTLSTGTKVRLFYPLNSKVYYTLERIILDKYKALCN